MLVAKNISYKIGSKALLDDVSVSFGPDKFNMVLGPNGAGKSTLVKVLCSHHRGLHGGIFYGDNRLEEMKLGEMAKFRAVLSQNIDLAFPLAVEEVVMMGRYPHFVGHPKDKDHEAVRASMELFDIAGFRGRDYMTLSGGEKQRVHFARVLAQIWYPVPGLYRYLLLDEPLTYLDIHYQYDFLNKVRSLMSAGDLVVVGVLHDLNLAAKFADHIVMLYQGKVLAEGEKKAVLTTESISMAYKMSPEIRTAKGELRLFF